MTSRYYTMTDSTGESGFLPTVTFTSADATFTSAERTAQLGLIGITGLYEADFADNITTIDTSAFDGDVKVVVVTINKVTTIGANAFKGCSALRSITLDCAVDANKKYLLTSIGSNAFQSCTSLRHLHIPDTVRNIPDYMCDGCTNLEFAVIGYGWDRTGDTYNTSFNSVNNKIGSYAFNSCTNLSYFVVPETMAEIGNNAFANCSSLALVTILGTPTVGTDAFFQSKNDSSVIYYYNTTNNISGTFPSAVSKRAYQEVTFSATGDLQSTTVVSALSSVTSYWKGKILNGVTAIGTAATPAIFRPASITSTKYSNMIGMSFPSTLTTIRFGTFEAWVSAGVYAPCNVTAYYLPNSVVSFPQLDVNNLASATFNLGDDGNRIASSTRQFVFLSGTNTVTLGRNMFKDNCTRAYIIPNITILPAYCFYYSQNAYFFSFFQKNAYTLLTTVGNDTEYSLEGCFKRGVTGYRHYVHLPKQISHLGADAFRNIAEKLVVTAYHNTISSAGVTTASAGMGFGYLAYSPSAAGSRFMGVAPTIHLIYNYVSNGIAQSASSSIGNNFPLHVLYPSNVTDIPARFATVQGLKSIAIHHSASPTVTIYNEGFGGCSDLNFVYLNNRVKVIGYNAFRNVPLSNSFDLIDASPLEQIYHAAFHTDPTHVASNLVQITIPNTVKILGSYIFSGGALGKKPSFTTLSFETGIEFWGDVDNTIGASSAIASFGTLNSSNTRHMAIPAFMFYYCDSLRNVSFLNTVMDLSGTPVPNDGLALSRPDNTLPITTRYNSQILNPLIKRIGSSTFAYNHRLQSIRIPEGVTAIDGSAFYDAYSLTYLYLPDTLTSIGTSAFNYLNHTNKFSYTGLEVSVRIPQSRIDDVANPSDIKFNPGSSSTYFITVAFNNTAASGKVTSGVLGRFTSRAVDPYIKYHVVILSGITGILGGTTDSARAFDGYSSLKTVTIPDSVTNIGVAAFYNCTGLTNAFISSTTSITAINESVFHNCSSLTGGFLLGSWLITIGINAFRNARLSNTFDLSSASNLQAIHHAAFMTDGGFTSNLVQITIPKSLKALGSFAFASGDVGLKPSFTTLSFENGIEFWGDYNYTSVVTGVTLTNYGYPDTSHAKYMAIPYNLCAKCDNLRNVSFLDTVMDLSGNPVPADANGALVRPNNSLPISTRYNKQILNPGIKRIGLGAFISNHRLQSIRIPDTVTTIDASGFFDTYSVTYVYIPDSVTTMGLAAFNYVGSVNKFSYTGNEVSVRIPQGLIDLVVPDTLYNHTGYFNTNATATRFFTVSFDYSSSKVTTGVLGRFTTAAANTYIKYHVVIQPGITGILGSYTASTRAFDRITGLKTITIADTVTNIGPAAAEACSGLTNVFISPSSNLTLLENAAFVNCTALTSFFIPNSLKYMDTSVFNNTGLTSVIYGDNPGLKFIGHACFYGTPTKTLTSIFIPSSVVHIGSEAFITNDNTETSILNTITFGAGSRIKSIDYRCFGHNGNRIQSAAQYLQDLVLPNGLRYIGDTSTANTSPFQNTHRLAHSANLIVPSSVEVIPWAFLYADGTPADSTVDISNVYFPRSITTVAGPRVHNGYSLSGGLIGAEFRSSRAGSLIYLPSELSGYTTRAGYPFPNNTGTEAAGRSRSFYKTVSFTGNSLVTLGLGLSVANTADAGSTSQIHANIQEGVIVIGGGTTSIAGTGNSLRNLISVNIPSTVTDICANAFNGCSALVYVTFSENSHLTTIDSSGFAGCSMIHDIQLPDSLTTIGANAFNGCYNLASISIPYNVTSIGAGAFNVNSSSPTTYIPRQRGYHADQLGGDIYGEAIGDYSGECVSLSQDGKILAIGARLNDAGGGDAGQVRVYKYQTITDTTWANYTVGSFFQNGTAPFNKPIVVNGGDSSPIANKYYWVQLGSDINGEAGYNYAGWSVSLSSDGTTVAIGALVNSGAGFDAGQVRVYKYQTVTDASWNSYTINSFTYNGTAPTNKPIIANGGDANPVSGKSYWVQLGVDIDGETINSQSGNSVSLSSNGQILAVGARFDDLNSAADSGSVRVYQYSSGTGTWSKLGSTITAGSAADEFGYSVSLNDAGTVLAIGAMRTDIPAIDAGTVRVYAYSSNTWTQRGSNINSEATYDYSGVSVSLNSDGTILAIGSIGYDGNGNDSGQVRVYNWNGSSWTKLGQNINGTSQFDELGVSVSLNGDGTILAVGSRNSDTGSLSNTGLVRIYKYLNSTWQQLGQDIRGEIANDTAAWSVSLSHDGTTVAFGAHGNDINGDDSGRVRVYQISNFTVRMHQRLYDTIHASFSTYFPGISPGSVQVIPALTLTNTLNPAKLTISQINNLYIRYRQSQLGFCTKVTVAASSGGTLTFSDVTNALASSTGLVHLDISTNVINVDAEVCLNNLRIYSVAIPKTVTNIRFSAFNSCTNLSYLSFHPDSVCTSIALYAFHNTNIIDLALPDSLTTIDNGAFRSSWRLTLVCVPKNVTAIDIDAFSNCPKLTAAALPTPLSTAATSSYFNTNGTTVIGSFTIYETSTAIPHFKLSDYSMPNGIVQTVIDSAVKYIDHRAYAYYPDITLYAVTTNKQTQTAGPINYVMNGIKMPVQPAAFIINPANGWAYTSMFPLFRSVPDLNVFTLSNSPGNWVDNSDDYYLLMPEYSICIFNKLYEEENLFWNASASYRYYDNEFGTTPLNINIPSGFLNTTSSILIMYKGRILSKYFTN